MEQPTHLPNEMVRFGALVKKRTLKSIKLLQVDLGMDERFSVASERNSATLELLVACATALLQEAKSDNRDPDYGSFVEWLGRRQDFRAMMKKRRFALRPPAERDAIARYCASAHPSNVPQDVNRAQWAFDERPDGSLDACLLLDSASSTRRLLDPVGRMREMASGGRVRRRAWAS